MHTGSYLGWARTSYFLVLFLFDMFRLKNSIFWHMMCFNYLLKEERRE